MDARSPLNETQPGRLQAAATAARRLETGLKFFAYRSAITILFLFVDVVCYC
jgi:hypothetical protein